MKKLLLFLSAIALITSCSKSTFESPEQRPDAPTQTEGIIFQMSPQTKATLGLGVEGGVTSAWEQYDKLDIFYVQAQKGGVAYFSSTWDAGKVATYVAAKSATKSEFIAYDDSNILKYLNAASDQDPKFRLVWAAKPVSKSSTENTLLANLPAINEQEYKDLKGSNIAKIRFAAGGVDDSWKAPNGKVQLNNFVLNTLNPMGYFHIKGWDKAKFGYLQKVTIEMRGQNIGVNAVKPSAISYKDDYYQVNIEKFVKKDAVAKDFLKVIGTAANDSTTVNINFTSSAQAAWAEDGYTQPIYFILKAVDRSKFTEALPEYYDVTCTFSKGAKVVRTFTTYKSWEWNKTYKFKDVDLANENSQPYYVQLITEDASDKYRLFINDLPATDYNRVFLAKGIAKSIGSTDYYPYGKIEQLVFNQELKAAAVPYLGKLPKLKKVHFTDATKTLIAGSLYYWNELTDLVADEVTSISSDVFKSGTPLADNADALKNLEVVNMPMYTFVQTPVATYGSVIKRLLPKSTLTSANLDSFKFDKDIIANFAGYGVVGRPVYIHFNENCTELPKDAFKGAYVNLTNIPKLKFVKIGESAFENFNTTEEYKLIYLPTNQIEEIGNRAFVGAELPGNMYYNSLVKLGDEAFETASANEINPKGMESFIAPKVTSIGKSAFKNRILLKNIQIPSVIEIGDDAFATTIVEGDLDIDKAMWIGENAFQGTKITSVKLGAALQIGSAAFTGTKIVNVNLPKAWSISDAFSGITTLDKVVLGVPQYTRTDIHPVTWNPKAFVGSAITYLEVADTEISDDMVKAINSAKTAKTNISKLKTLIANKVVDNKAKVAFSADLEDLTLLEMNELTARKASTSTDVFSKLPNLEVVKMNKLASNDFNQDMFGGSVAKIRELYLNGLTTTASDCKMEQFTNLRKLELNSLVDVPYYVFANVKWPEVDLKLNAKTTTPISVNGRAFENAKLKKLTINASTVGASISSKSFGGFAAETLTFSGKVNLVGDMFVNQDPNGPTTVNVVDLEFNISGVTNNTIPTFTGRISVDNLTAKFGNYTSPTVGQSYGNKLLAFTVAKSMNLKDATDGSFKISSTINANVATLTTVTLPEVTGLAAGAFNNCSVVTSLTLPKVKYIGNGAFLNTAQLKTINIGSGLATTDKIVFASAADVFNCTTTSAIIFGKALEIYGTPNTPITAANVNAIFTGARNQTEVTVVATDKDAFNAVANPKFLKVN